MDRVVGMWAHRARAAGLALLIAYAFAVAPGLSERVVPLHPASVSDIRAYELATRDEFASLLPVQHVEYEEASDALGSADGCFCPGSGTIIIRTHGGTLSADAYLSILRHEYGHAVLYEWCAEEGCGGAGFESVLADRLASPCDVPAGLTGPALDYRAQPGLFGEYARASLGEWLAEACASYVAEEPVPSRTRAFFDSLRTGDARAGGS